MTHKPHHARIWRLCTVFAAGCLLTLANAGSARADISIRSASWSNSTQQLDVSGRGAQRNSTVTITYAGDNAPIGTTETNRRGRWSSKFSNLNPVPCRVRASNGSDSATRTVSNAGSNCSDNGATSNAPPTANVNGPYTGMIGAAVSFSSAGSSDPDGSIAGYAWTFGDGGTSTQANPTHSYSAANTYTVNLTVTDNDGASTTATTTATISASTPVNTPPVADTGGPYTGTAGTPVTFNGSGSSDSDGSIVSYAWTFGDGANGAGMSPSHTYAAAGTYTVSLTVTDNDSASTTATTTAAISGAGGITSRGDTYATPVGTTLNVTASRISGVLYNDFGGSGPLTAQLVSGPANGSLNLSSDGSFTYTPGASLSDNDNDSFTYQASDGTNLSAVTTVNINILSKQEDFKIMMNYELGMHCTGFEFAYCCVLPPYNSILAQVVKPESGSGNSRSFPRLLEGDPNNTDGLGRQTVVRDYERNGTIKKYFLEYYHDAQPRHEGQGKPQTSTLISDVEGNSLFYHSTIYDSASPDGNNRLQYGPYEGVYGVVQGDGYFPDTVYDPLCRVYRQLRQRLAESLLYLLRSGGRQPGEHQSGLRQDPSGRGRADRVPGERGRRAASHGPGFERRSFREDVGFDNVLTFSGENGTVVYTQMKVLENLPIMLTAPRIWEALGLPLTPFEDSIDFFSPMGPGSLDEDSIRPYVAMKAALHVANCDSNGQNCTQGAAVIGSNGKPVIGHGTAPIDIPNCERCHSVPAMTDGVDNTNSPNFVRSSVTVAGMSLEAATDAEKSFWDAYYNINTAAGDSDWYSRLKSAAINMLALHDCRQRHRFHGQLALGQCERSGAAEHASGQGERDLPEVSCGQRDCGGQIGLHEWRSGAGDQADQRGDPSSAS